MAVDSNDMPRCSSDVG